MEPIRRAPQTCHMAESQAAARPGTPSGAVDLGDPQYFLNRELSWVAFNARVLEGVRNPALPLYERLKFLSIVSANLDEFFMVRVAGLKQQILGGVAETPPDGLLPAAQIAAIRASSSTKVWPAFTCTGRMRASTAGTWTTASARGRSVMR